MPKITISVVIQQDPSIIHLALMNPNNHIYWTSHLEKFEIIKNVEGNVGSIAHLYYNEKGRKYMMSDELLEVKAEKFYRSKVLGNGLEIFIETQLEKLENGTKMTIKWVGSINYG